MKTPRLDEAVCAEVVIKCPKCGPMPAHLDLKRVVGKKALKQIVQFVLNLHLEMEHPKKKANAAS